MSAEVTGLRSSVPCPRCKNMSTRESWPFCSKRCADLDLGKWFDGTYTVPVVEEDSGHAMDEADGSSD